MSLLTPPVSVIAVDGGGTRCRIACEGAAGRRTIEVGAANVTTDFDAAIGAISAGIGTLADALGVDLADLSDCPAYLGLAGVTDAAMGRRVAAALPLRHARVEDDRRSALRGALGARDGAIAHCGTGSFFALQDGGAMRLSGGWGSRLGDEASAFWVARAALSATLVAVDGLDEPTTLTEALLARIGSPAAIVGLAASAAPAEIAAFAPMVTEAAAEGDPLARRILQSGADHIAHVTGKMGWRPGMALCLTGGLAPVYQTFLPANLAAALVAPDGPPIEGAIALARAFAAEVWP